jgi:hypothetical protein
MSRQTLFRKKKGKGKRGMKIRRLLLNVHCAKKIKKKREQQIKGSKLHLLGAVNREMWRL